MRSSRVACRGRFEFAYGESVQTVKVVVAAPVRLSTDRKSTRNGFSVKFVGRVPGAGGARARVELQAWAGRLEYRSRRPR